MSRANILRFSATLVFVVLLGFLIELTGLRAKFSLDYLRTTIESNLYLGLLIFLGMFILGNLIQVPGWIFMVAALLALGKVAGSLVTYTAAVISCSVTYVIIGCISKDVLRSIENRFAQRLIDSLDTNPVQSVVLLRAFFGSAPILNYTLAMSGVRFRSYLMGTLLGLTIPTFLHAIFFEFLAEQVFCVTI